MEHVSGVSYLAESSPITALQMRVKTPFLPSFPGSEAAAGALAGGAGTDMESPPDIFTRSGEVGTLGLSPAALYAATDSV